MISERLLTLEEAATLLGVSREWLRRRRKTFDFVVALTPRIYRVDPVKLRRYLERKTGR